MERRVLHLIPEDPGFNPDVRASNRAAQMLSSMLGGCDEIRAEPTEEVHCPVCASDVSLWWRRLLRKFQQGDGLAAQVRTPCCDSEAPVEAFEVKWPDVVASFVLEAHNPARLRFLDDTEQERIEELLGCGVRQVVSRA